MYKIYYPYEDVCTHLELLKINKFIKLIEDKLIKFAYAFYSIPISHKHELHIKVYKRILCLPDARVLGTFCGQNIKRPEIQIFGAETRNLENLTKTFFHEFTHYKQWVYDYEMRDFVDQHMEYKKRPYEIEAWDNEEIMYDHMKKYWNNYMKRPEEFSLT